MANNINSETKFTVTTGQLIGLISAVVGATLLLVGAAWRLNEWTRDDIKSLRDDIKSVQKTEITYLQQLAETERRLSSQMDGLRLQAMTNSSKLDSMNGLLSTRLDGFSGKLASLETRMDKYAFQFEYYGKVKEPPPGEDPFRNAPRPQ